MSRVISPFPHEVEQSDHAVACHSHLDLSLQNLTVAGAAAMAKQ
jgi:hypothetical protein